MLVIDVEIYRDYFLLSALQPETGKVRHFEIYDDHRFNPKELNGLMRSYTTVSFNGNNFDLPLILMALHGAKPEALKRIADQIIIDNTPHGAYCAMLIWKYPPVGII